MENLELIFENIKVNDIEEIFKELEFEKDKIINSHFFIDNENKEYSDVPSFAEYFKNKGTCNLLIKNLNLGVIVNKAIIIISFDEIYGDMTINFSENDWGNEDKSDEKKADMLYQKISMLTTKINYSSIFFGYEPADDEDMQLFHI